MMKRIAKTACRIAALTFLSLSLTACAIHKKTGPQTGPDGTHHTHTHIKKLNKKQKAVMKEAREWLGTPYKYAHAEKGSATDCSGFVMQTYLEATDISLPRNSAKQAEYCHPVNEKDVRAGDLVFFATGSDPHKVSHVGIVLDEPDAFIHASSKLGVTVTKLSNPWYVKRLLMYGRVPKMDD